MINIDQQLFGVFQIFFFNEKEPDTKIFKSHCKELLLLSAPPILINSDVVLQTCLSLMACYLHSSPLREEWVLFFSMFCCCCCNQGTQGTKFVYNAAIWAPPPESLIPEVWVRPKNLDVQPLSNSEISPVC